MFFLLTVDKILQFIMCRPDRFINNSDYENIDNLKYVWYYNI